MKKFDLINFIKYQNIKNYLMFLEIKKILKFFYDESKKNEFSYKVIKKYILFESNRWDMVTKIKN